MAGIDGVVDGEKVFEKIHKNSTVSHFLLNGGRYWDRTLDMLNLHIDIVEIPT